MASALDTPMLDPMLCFAVYSLDRRIGRVYQELLAPWKLSYTQYLVLLVLPAAGESPGAPDDAVRTVKQLGEALDLDSGTLSPLLKRLESRGLILRERSADDQRVVLVSLTPTGAGLRAELGSVQRCLIERMPITPEDATDLVQRVRALSSRLAAA